MFLPKKKYSSFRDMYQNSYKRNSSIFGICFKITVGRGWGGGVRRGEGYTRSKMGHNLMFVETGKSVPDFTVLASLFCIYLEFSVTKS